MDNWDSGDPRDDRTDDDAAVSAEEPEGAVPPEESDRPLQDDATVSEDAEGLEDVDTAEEAEGAADPAAAEAPQEPWPSSRLPWEVADSVAAGTNGREQAPPPAPEPAPVPIEESPADPPLPRRPRLVPVLIALVVVVASLSGGVAYYFHTEAAQRKAALEAAVQAVALTASPEFADTIQQRLAPIRQAIDEGKYAEATNRLSHIMRDVAPAEPGAGAGGVGPPGGMLGGPPEGAGGPPAPGGHGGGPSPSDGPGAQGPPPEATDLPPAALAFFEANPELAETVGQANMAGLKLREMGGNVDRLREIRGSIIEAARLHDKDKVIALLRDFQKELQAQAAKLGPAPGRIPGGPRLRPGANRAQGGRMPPRDLMALVQQVNAEMQEAQSEGKDLRKAAGLMQQAERAGAVGQFSRATDLTRQALRAIDDAPKLPPEPELFSNPLVAMFLDLMNVEDTELAATLAALRKTLDEAGEAAVAGLREALKEAADTLAKVGARRQAFSKRLQEIRGGEPPSPEEQRQAAAQMRRKIDEARAELAGILAKSRDLDPEQFAGQRDKIVDSILETLFGPPPAGSADPSRLVRLPTTEERVRAKLLSASDAYLEVLADEARKELAATTGALFREARAHLAARRYAQAEDLVDRGLELLGLPVEPRREEAAEGHDATVPEARGSLDPAAGDRTGAAQKPAAEPPPDAADETPRTP